MHEACEFLAAEEVTKLQTKKVSDLAKSLIKKHGLALAADVAEQVISEFNLTIEREVQEENQRIIAEGQELELIEE